MKSLSHLSQNLSDKRHEECLIWPAEITLELAKEAFDLLMTSPIRMYGEFKATIKVFDGRAFADILKTIVYISSIYAPHENFYKI